MPRVSAGLLMYRTRSGRAQVLYAGPCKPAGQWDDLEWDITDGVTVVELNGEVIEPAWTIGKIAKQGVGLQKEKGDSTSGTSESRRRSEIARLGGLNKLAIGNFGPQGFSRS